MNTSSDVREEACEIVVIGAGMAGLMAATTLSDRDVVVLEATGRAGGRVESVRQGDYWINLGTQFTEGTGTLIEALERHQVPMGTLAGKKVALALNGKQVDTSNPFGLMFRSRMGLMDRVGLAAVGARIVAAVPFLAMNPRQLPGEAGPGGTRRPSRVVRAARHPLRRRAGHGPVLVRPVDGMRAGGDGGDPVRDLDGDTPDGPGEGSQLLPAQGGNQTLTDILAADLGDRLRLDSPVTSVQWTEDDVVVDYADERGPARIRARRAVVAVPSDVAVKIMPGLPPGYRAAFDDIHYGRYVVVGYFTREEGPQRWDDYIAVSTPQLSFQAMFNHAAALRGPGPRKPGGALACFAGGAVADRLFELTDQEILDRFTRDLLSLYPELEGKLDEGIVRRHHRVVPFWAPGGRASLPTLREHFGPVYFAGDYQLDMPSLADAATSGERAAQQALASLTRPAR